MRKPYERHGLSRSSTYRVWDHMVQRCTNRKHKHWGHYGGRGIGVCSRWRDSFSAFIEDVGARPDDSMTIERDDVNGNYEPGNCRWATRAEQQINTRIQVNNSTGIRGVSWDKRRQRYESFIGRLGVKINLGYSADLFEASCKRKSAENRYWT